MKKSTLINELIQMRSDDNTKTNYNNYVYATYTKIINRLEKMEDDDDDDMK